MEFSGGINLNNAGSNDMELNQILDHLNSIPNPGERQNGSGDEILQQLLSETGTCEADCQFNQAGPFKVRRLADGKAKVYTVSGPASPLSSTVLSPTPILSPTPTITSTLSSELSSSVSAPPTSVGTTPTLEANGDEILEQLLSETMVCETDSSSSEIRYYNADVSTREVSATNQYVGVVNQQNGNPDILEILSQFS